VCRSVTMLAVLRACALVLLIYVSMDFADPNMPGALNFDLNQSVDATYSTPRALVSGANAASSPVPPELRTARLVAEPHESPRRITLRPVVRQEHKPHTADSIREAPASSDDH